MNQPLVAKVVYIPSNIIDKYLEAKRASLLAEEFYSDDYAAESARKYSQLAYECDEQGFVDIAEMAMKQYDYWCNKSWEIYVDSKTREYWENQLGGLSI